MEQEAALPRNDGNVRRIQRLQEALELVRVKIAQRFQKQQTYYDLRRRSWTPSIGDKVLKKTQHLSGKTANFNAKLAGKFDGPYVVKKKPSPVIFDPQDDRGRYHRHLHIGKLKPYLEAAENQQLMPDSTSTNQRRPVPPPRPRQEQRHDTAVNLHQDAEQQTRKYLRRRAICLGSRIEAEGFRRFKEMGPQYHQVDQQGPTIRRATRPTLITSQRRATPLAAITVQPQVRGVEPIRDPGLNAKYLGLISANRPLTVTESPPTTPEISRQGATLARDEKRRPVPIIAAPLVEPG